MYHNQSYQRFTPSQLKCQESKMAVYCRPPLCRYKNETILFLLHERHRKQFYILLKKLYIVSDKRKLGGTHRETILKSIYRTAKLQKANAI
jgi:hypothetical protein